MQVYKIVTADGDFTYVVANDLREVFSLLNENGLEMEEVEDYPLTISICEPDEIIVIHYEDFEPPPHPPEATWNEDEQSLHSTAGQWVDYFEDRLVGRTISSSRWA